MQFTKIDKARVSSQDTEESREGSRAEEAASWATNRILTTVDPGT